MGQDNVFTGVCLPTTGMSTSGSGGGGLCLWVRVCVDTPTDAPDSQQVGGTHPTGMLSCFLFFFLQKEKTTRNMGGSDCLWAKYFCHFCQNIKLQECIQVGCVPSGAVAVLCVCVWGGGVCPGGCLSGLGVSQHALGQTLPSSHGQNDRQV